MNTFTVAVQLHNPQQQPLPGLQIQLWLEKQGADDQLAAGQTDAQGICRLSFDLQLDKRKTSPPFAYVYVRVYERGALIYSRPEGPAYPVIGSNTNIQITLDKPVRVRAVDRIPLDKSTLRLDLRDTTSLSESQRNFVRAKLNDALLEGIRRQLSEADARLDDAISGLTLDYQKFEEKTMGDVWKEAVLPFLQKKPEIWKIWEELRLGQVTEDKRIVREVLRLDVPLSKNPIFREESRIVRTVGLGEALGLSDDLTDMLAGLPLDLERASDADWQKLVDDKVISATEKPALQRGFAFSRFTGGNAALAVQLHQSLEGVRDMVRFEATDWLAMIKTAGNDTPNGETPEEYAANLLRLAQRSFPSAFLLERKVRRAAANQADLLAELRELQPVAAKSARVAKDVVSAPLSLENSPKLRATANTYRYLGAQDILTDPNLAPERKLEQLVVRQTHLKMFMEKNEGLDLRSADFFAKKEDGTRLHDYAGIPEENQANVRQQMMSYQRTLRLGVTYDAQDALLAAGLDSSHSIVQTKSSQLGVKLGGAINAAGINQIIVTAQAQYEQVIQATLSFQGIESSNYFGLQVLDYPEELRNHLQGIDGYSEMFGSQNFCECDHCKSIFGPAAYFVDLMRFVDLNAELATSAGILSDTDRDNHPISLATRRPDLWHLELTCENTNRPVPYLWLVNKIKITYLCKVLGIWDNNKNFDQNAAALWDELARLPLTSGGNSGGGSGGNNSGGGGAVNALPQAARLGMMNPLAGTTWKNSFRVAFNRPFEESLILLEALGVKYSNILRALKADDQYRREAAYLGLSEEEWNILTTEDIYLNDLVELRFAFPYEKPYPNEPGYFELAKCNVQAFQRATSLNREDAETLLGLPSLQAVSAAVRLVREAIPDEIQMYREWIEGLNDAKVLDFIHRFLRLWRHLPGWSLRELDLAVQRVVLLNPAGVAEIARIYTLQRELNLGFEEALAMQGDIPNARIYTRMVRNEFLNISVEEAVPGMLDRLFDPEKIDIRENPPSPTNMDVATLTTSGKLPYLLKGLGTTQADYERVYSLLFGTAAVVLNLKNVSDCYRFIRLAKALGVSVEELGYWLKLDNNSVALDTARMLEVVRLEEKVKSMPLSLHEMWFVANGESTENSVIKSAYSGVDDTGKSLALVAAETWTAQWLADKRLYISVEKLREYLPSDKRDTHIEDFIQELHQNNVLIPATEAGCRVTSIAPIQLSDIPATFGMDTATRQKLADDLNLQFIEDENGASIREGIIMEHVALAFQLDAAFIPSMSNWYNGYADVVDEALQNLTNESGTFAATDLTELTALFPQFERISLLYNRSGFDAEDANFVSNYINHFVQGSATNGFLSSLNTLAEFFRLSDYIRFKAQAGDAAAYRTALVKVKTTWFGSELNVMATVLGCESGQLKAIGNILTASDLSAFATDALTELEAAAGVLKTLGIYDHATLTALKECDYANAVVYEKPLRDAFRARYATEEDFEKAWEPYENRINELRRDVLCAFLLALDRDSQFQTTSDLYAYFLVDVEMSGCARVSEILAATLSLQLYVHRVIMGLEASVELQQQQNTGGNSSVAPFPAVRAYLGQPDLDGNSTDTQAIARKQWEWRKNYRVWEANRKVFLYPENWIEPELRDDKSPLFKTLEDELLQQKISLESAEAAYKEYLKGFAEVGQLVMAGILFHDGTPNKPYPTYHIFGRTKSDPYQYYYRKLYIHYNSADQTETKEFTAWEKVELAISAPWVSPFYFNSKMYLFWVEIASTPNSSISGGNSSQDGTSHKITVKYSYLQENGKWIQPQSINYLTNSGDYLFKSSNAGKDLITNSDTDYVRNYENSRTRQCVYPFEVNGQIYLYYEFVDHPNPIIIQDSRSLERSYRLDFFQNKVQQLWSGQIYNGSSGLVYQYEHIALLLNGNNVKFFMRNTLDNFSCEGEVVGPDPGAPYYIKDISNNFTYDLHKPDVRQVIPNMHLWLGNNAPSPVFHFGDSFLNIGRDSFLYRKLSNVKKDVLKFIDGLQAAFVKEFVNGELERMNTSVVGEFQSVLYNHGLEAFLDTNTQHLQEKPWPFVRISQYDLHDDDWVVQNPPSLRFNGAHGLYFRELFFHIPFLIADHLNAEGKYKEADYWYRKIFDPSADYDYNLAHATDRYWRFLEFRDQTFPKLKEILNDTAAIAVHENDPFNPHAIARLRIGAYMKCIVMKYVDNLLDWADSLFRRDTWESNTEALMLYMLAHDILGDRPEKLGKCESAVGEKNCGCAHPVNYAALKAHEDFGDSPFVYYVDNWVPNYQPAGSNGVLVGGLNDLSYVGDYEAVNQIAQPVGNTAGRQSRETGLPGTAVGAGVKASYGVSVSMGWQMYRKDGEKLVFCIPNNENMLAYWDRVEDRLFKLRHCMNIDGVKRSLALFQPPIDPALLVAAAAAGLSIDDVLNNLYGDLPAYRFSYLVEKAKMYAGTVQGFGSALLSALEKKDGEALTLLRSTQEQNILKLTKEVKKKAIEEAKANLQASVEGMVNVVNRQMHYMGLIETGLIQWEKIQQTSQHIASGLEIVGSIQQLLGAILYLLPDVGAPTAMKWGGTQLGNNAQAFAQMTSSLAAIARSISVSAGIEGSNKRREEDWKFQLKLAEQEIKQMQQQIVASTIRLAIAEKDLEIHEKQIEQTAELHDFYKNKFTGLGLYTYMASTLQRLHRMAYNAALDMAKQAEAAYKFETGDDTYTGISGGAFWDASRVGLLSGEQLTLELQQLETNFINWNRRQMEIRQSFSMRMIDPEALLSLRKDGLCTFVIPEWAFDMQYAGHYRRRLVSVQITIPCVAGPYTNVAATLSMTKGSLRKDSIKDGYDVKSVAVGFIFRGSSMIATSNANNDGGQFELNFRDERFLPFEGAGAVDSEWVLELPNEFRTFDYETISDVIFHLSYRSKYDGGNFKNDVLTHNTSGLVAKINGNNGNTGLRRLVSLKEEFPDALYQLTGGGASGVSIKLTPQHFPHFTLGKLVVDVNGAAAKGVAVTTTYHPSTSSTPEYWEFAIVKADHLEDDDVQLLVKYKIL